MSEEDLHMKDVVIRKFTHQEIHPSLIMGVLGLNIPFTQTNQAPRNVYSSAQGKQAVGLYATNFNNRMDNKVMVLAYPQKPIVTTHYAPYIRNEIMPHGINAVVAIMSYSGYN
jgi:DNA-directed RNA polymerase II subunit RPB2